MTPLPPVLAPTVSASNAPTTRLDTPGSTHAVTEPDLGRAAVTAADATKDTDLHRTDTAEVDPLEPPADPPPVKGLGIPPLHMEQVGDLDKPEATPPAEQNPAASLTQSLAELAETTAPLVDLRR